METGDYVQFRQILKRTMALYDKPLTSEMADLWFDALFNFDLADVGHAMTAHIRNSDGGQFAPKPADIIRALTGGLDGVCQAAWTKVAGAVGSAGPWQSVAFDDPIIHRVLADMGGWPAICQKDEKEWPFTQKEFLQRYKAIQIQQKPVEHTPYLIGLAEAENTRRGIEAPKKHQALTFVGDRQRAQAVIASGNFGATVKTERLAHDRQNNRAESAGGGETVGRNSGTLQIPDLRV